MDNQDRSLGEGRQMSRNQHSDNTVSRTVTDSCFTKTLHLWYIATVPELYSQ